MIKVVVHTEGLLGWGGGIDFLKYYLSILNQLENIRTIVAIPYDIQLVNVMIMAHFGLIIKILKFKCIVEVRYRLVCKRQMSFF